MNLSAEDLRRVREKMDLTDAQVAAFTEAVTGYPETAKAIEAFGKALKKMGVSEEHQLEIARAIGPVLETVAKEASSRAWSAIDRHLEKLREITEAPSPAHPPDELMDPLEGVCASLDGSVDGDPLDVAAQAEEE